MRQETPKFRSMTRAKPTKKTRNLSLWERVQFIKIYIRIFQSKFQSLTSINAKSKSATDGMNFGLGKLVKGLKFGLEYHNQTSVKVAQLTCSQVSVNGLETKINFGQTKSTNHRKSRPPKSVKSSVKQRNKPKSMLVKQKSNRWSTKNKSSSFSPRTCEQNSLCWQMKCDGWVSNEANWMPIYTCARRWVLTLGSNPFNEWGRLLQMSPTWPT